MKKSLIFYLSQIKEAYPEITDIKKAEFEKISAQINAQIQTGEPVTTHKQLYSKTYRFLKILANYYAENGINYRTFNDNLSALQLEIMEKFNEKIARNEWFANFPSFVSAVSSYSNTFIKNFQKETASQKKTKAKLVDNLLDEKVNEIYEEELRNVDINELKALLSEAMDTLTSREKEFLIKYYGLNGDQALTKAELASSKNITQRRVYEILYKALDKLRYPRRARKLYDYFKNYV